MRIDSRRAIVAALVAIFWVTAQPLTLAGIRVYHEAVSPLAARVGIRCRFTPTCSRYAEVVIARDGLIKGGWKTVKRIVRCNPLTPAGTHDDP